MVDLPIANGARSVAPHFTAADGTSLEMRILSREGSHNYAVFHNPGLGDFSGYLKFARYLHKLGWNVVLKNDRGIRNSDGLYTPENLINDDKGLVESIRLENPEATVVGIGSCLGSYVQVMANQDYYRERGTGLYDALLINGIPDLPMMFASASGSEKLKKAGEVRAFNDKLRKYATRYIPILDTLRYVLSGGRAKPLFVEEESGCDRIMRTLKIPRDSYFEVLGAFARSRPVDYSQQPKSTRIVFVEGPRLPLDGITKAMAFLTAILCKSYLSRKVERRILKDLREIAAQRR